MLEFGIGCPDIAITRLAQAKAEIDVVERDLEVDRVHAAHFKVDRLADHHAGRRDGGERLDQCGATRIAFATCRHAAMRMRRQAADAEEDARVLKRHVGVPQARAHRTHARLQREARHFRQPFGRQHLDVVVDQRHQFAPRLGDGIVVDLRVVEGAVVSQHPNLGSLGQLAKVVERPGIVRPVVDQQDLERRVGRARKDRIDALAGQFGRVARRDHDRNHRSRLGQSVTRAIAKAHEFRQGMHAGPREMLVQRALAGECRIRLGIHGFRRAFAVHAPVVEHARNVLHLLRRQAFHAAQHQVPVLGAFQADPEPADFAHQRSLQHTQVAEHVLRPEEVDVPVGLEIWARAAALLVDLVLVRIDQAGVGVPGDAFGDPVQRVRRQQVVVVHQGQPRPAREFDGTVGRGGDVSVLGTEHDLDARVAVAIGFEHRAHLRRWGCIVCDAQLPVWVDLVPHRFDRLAQPGRARVVAGHDDRDQRRRAHRRHPLADGCTQFGRERVVAFDPPVVVVGAPEAPPEFPADAGQARSAEDAPCALDAPREVRPAQQIERAHEKAVDERLQFVHRAPLTMAGSMKVAALRTCRARRCTPSL